MNLPAGLAALGIVTLVGGVVLGNAFGDGATADPTPTMMAASPEARDLPEADVPGEDLARLPRYDGSVRTDYAVIVDERFRLTTTEYLADAPLDDVRTFYRGVIVQHGWERADIGYSGGEWTYVLVDGSTEALIEIEETAGLIEIDLQISEPIDVPAPEPQPTPPPATAPPPPAPVVPDDDDGGDGDDGDGETDD